MNSKMLSMAFVVVAIVSMNSLYSARYALINEPIVDLRIKPIEVTEFFKCDDNQDSQLLYGEKIEILQENDEWFYIKALEQLDFYAKNQWCPMEGWIKKSTVKEVEAFPQYNAIVSSDWATILNEDDACLYVFSCGTRLLVNDSVKDESSDYYTVALIDGRLANVSKKRISLNDQNLTKNEKREIVIAVASQFTGTEYRWGGRSFYDPLLNRGQNSQRTGVDCSGLTNLSYRVAGIDIPRNAKDQYKYSKHLESAQSLKTGDLIFFARTNDPAKIMHVMMYDGKGFLLEATGGEIQKNIKTSVVDRLGKSLNELVQGDKVTTFGGNEFYVFFGTYFS